MVTPPLAATVRLAPAVSVVPGSGQQGGSFQVVGSGFAPGEQITFVVSGTPPQTLGADAIGGVQATLRTGPTDPPGTYTVGLSGRSSGAQASGAFSLTAAPVAALEATARPTLAPLPTVPPEPYGVFMSENEVFVGQRSVLENTPSCQFRGWGLDCARKLRDVTTLRQVLGPFGTSSEARTAFCGAYVANSWRMVPLGAGYKAKFSFAPEEIYVNNVSSC
jgi:hypothetical protein